MTHICVCKLTIIGSDNGLSPRQRQAIIWTNAGIWLIRPLGTEFGEILIEIHKFSFKKMHLKMSSARRRPICLGLNVFVKVFTKFGLTCLTICAFETIWGHVSQRQLSSAGTSNYTPQYICGMWLLVPALDTWFRHTSHHPRLQTFVKHLMHIHAIAKVIPFKIHDDVTIWKHFPRYWPFVRGIHRSPVNSPHKSQWCGALMFSLICVLNKRLGKQSWGWWFETPSRPLWRHFNAHLLYISYIMLKTELKINEYFDNLWW